MPDDHVAYVPVFRPSPEVIAGSQLTAFISYCERKTGLSIGNSASLHEYAIREFRDFWRLFLSWSKIDFDGSIHQVCTDDRCENATFFPDLKLSYVENLLRIASEQDGDRPALTCCHASGVVEKLNRRSLQVRVMTLAAKLKQLGVEPGDRIGAVAHNNSGAVIGALAASVIGATFSSASPEMGVPAILSRFRQLSPKILMAHLTSAGQMDQGALSERIAEVTRSLPSLDALIILDEGQLSTDVGVTSWRLSKILGEHDRMAEDAVTWQRFPFNHPLFILFSSGTTGKPKCIVHGAGGTLLEHMKEHRLHGDLRATDKLFFHTSTAWMMWNWQLSALACGAEIVLFDGPVTGPETLWRLVSEHEVTVFGTSPPFLKLCEDMGYSPRGKLSLSSLRGVLSTGSVLLDHQYDWVREHVGSVPLQSISGGTDIIGCFVLGNPNLPVYRGESQCRSLGLDVRALDPAVEQSNIHLGELVCQNPFPSRPLAFHGDHDGSQFHKAYFQQNPGMWTHGDLIEFTKSGGARLHGRSDSVLNINGIRIGPAEIYYILQGFPEIQEAMAVEQRTPKQGDESRLVLVVVPREPGTVDNVLRAKIRKELALQASPTHVPARIVEVAELPVTYSGKRSERAVRDALNGTAGTNTEALRNPGCLEDIRRQVGIEDESLLSLGDAGRGNAEDRLRPIWERVLGFRDVDADDSFFSLGGSSIMAVHLCQEINDQLGLAIGPWVLFYAPTLRALTLALDTKGGTLSPIAPLRAGGVGQPIILLPGMFGDIMELRSLLGRMHCTRPLYGVRARGLAPGESPHGTVEAMADDYLEHLRRLQPSGPYSLVGYSFGGLVAFEMACRLREAHEDVAFLGLIDTDVHEGCLRLDERLQFWLTRPWRYCRLIAESPITTVPELIHRFFRTRSNIVTSSRNSEIAMPPLLLHIGKVNRRAFARYRPRRYDGSITVFRAANRWPRFCDPLPVWQRLAGADVAVRTIAGSHTALVQEPAVSALAKNLELFIASEEEMKAGAGCQDNIRETAS